MSSFNAQAFLATLTTQAGVYRLLDAQGQLLYIGKARNLKQRLQHYFNLPQQASTKLHQLVAQIAAVEVTITATESEALLLENNLIKTHQPRYNVLLRDDKSYPYLYLSVDSDFPRLSWHRGAKQSRGRYFGPYPHVGAARHSLKQLQKLFQLRSCTDSVYRHRSRPCLLYQIKRCSAPCVDLIDRQHYQQALHHAILFLEGKSQTVINVLIEQMQAAAQALAFERAAQLRDQISQLRTLQAQQYIDAAQGDVDIVAAALHLGQGCIELLWIRAGRLLGNRTFWPQHPADIALSELLSGFLSQYYLAPGCDIPAEIILSHEIDDMSVLTETLPRALKIHARVRGKRARWVAMALENAHNQLMQHRTQVYLARLTALTQLLGLTELPERLECFDVSHTQGEATVAACVVFDAQGPKRQAYRRFNISGITAGDDYLALHQALSRRYRQCEQLPDIILIDGGLAQVKVATTVLAQLQLTDTQIIGITKGPGRQPHLDKLVIADRYVKLSADSKALQLLQQLRDEAHRYALHSHRRRRARARNRSVLEQIEGIGPQRRQQLLTYFGGLQGIRQASIDELAQVPGINRSLAQRIYHFFITT